MQEVPRKTLAMMLKLQISNAFDIDKCKNEKSKTRLQSVNHNIKWNLGVKSNQENNL